MLVVSLPFHITQPPRPLSPRMASSPRAGQTKAVAQPSVFNALGSYADRIKATDKSPSGGSAELKPSSSSTSSPSLAAAASIRSPPARPQAVARKVPAADLPPPVVEDDGPWETVQSGRRKEKPSLQQQHQTHHSEERRAGPSNSANWRERPTRRSKEEEDRMRGAPGQAGQATKGKKETSSSVPPPLTEKRSGGPGSFRSAAGAQGTPSTQAAWDASYPSLPPSQVLSPPKTREETPSSTASHAIHTPQAESAHPQRSRTEPSSPQLAADCATTPSLSTSVASPDISNDNASQSTAPTSLALRDEDEGAWRVRPRQASADAGVAVWQGPVSEKGGAEAKVEEAVQDKEEKPEDKKAAKKPFPPPAVNAWALPKKPTVFQTGAQPTAAGTAPQSSVATAQPLQFGTLGLDTQAEASATAAGDGISLPVRTGLGNPVSQKKKKKTTPTAVDTPQLSAAAFPDLAQAVKMEQAVEEEKSRVAAERKEAASAADDASVADEAAGKKPKWTAIPAAELQAAMDEAAESSRRQARAETAARKKAGKSRSVPPSNAPSPTKSGARATLNGAEGSAGANVKLPPVPQGQQANGAASKVRPTFGSILPAQSDNSSSSVPAATDDQSTSRGGFSEPMSRRSSKNSGAKGHSLSPRKARSSLPSPSFPTSSLPENPYKAQHVRSGSSSLPSGSHPFQGQGMAGVPLRRGRGAFGGRGRGGFRGGYMGKFGSPPAFGGMLPNGGGMYAGQGFGGYPFYPPQGYGGANGSGFYDPVAASFAGMGGASPYSAHGAAPAPLPITPVSSTMDPQRFYLLGQIEYYFSEQNLAMDLFLRQQMDSEGWIDIPTIAAFNRVRSLGPDLAAVKETMKISQLLEVSADEEKVRLSNGLAKRYVLPDARVSGVSRGADGDESAATGSALSPTSGPTELGETSGGANGLSLSLGSISMGVGPSGMGLDMGMGMGMPGTSDSLGLPEGGSQRQGRTYSRGEVESMLMKNGGGLKERAATEPAVSRGGEEKEREEVLVNGDEAR